MKSLVQSRVGVTGEECNEIAQMCSKIERFGMHEIFPGQPLTNAERTHMEIDELHAMIELLNEEHGFGYSPNRERIEAKKAKVRKYEDYSRELGLLEHNASVKGQSRG